MKAESIISRDDSFTSNPNDDKFVGVWEKQQLWRMSLGEEGFAECKCRDFKHYNGICCHVVAYAEKKKRLPDFLAYVMDRIREKDQLVALDEMPGNKGAGQKPGIPRRGGMNSAKKRPIPTMDTSVPKRPVYAPHSSAPRYPTEEQLQELRVSLVCDIHLLCSFHITLYQWCIFLF